MWVSVREMHCITHTRHTPTLQHYSTCSSPHPAERHNRCTTALARAGHLACLVGSPPFDPTFERPPLFFPPDVDAARTTSAPRDRLSPSSVPPASSSTPAPLQSPSQWPCTHGREDGLYTDVEEEQSYTGREKRGREEKEGPASRASEEAARYTNRPPNRKTNNTPR